MRYEIIGSSAQTCSVCNETQNIMLVKFFPAGKKEYSISLCPRHLILITGTEEDKKPSEEGRMRCCGKLVNQYNKCSICGDQY